MKNYNVEPIKGLLTNVKNALIVVPTLSIDGISSALAFAVALKKNNINAQVYCPQKTDNNYSKLNGLELLTDSFSFNDLTVTLEYPLDQIENVSYNDNGGKLNLVVKTKPGSPKVENELISINNQSASIDVCFMLGDEAGLGPNTPIIGRYNWVHISPVSVTKPWAKASLIDPDAPFSEIFTFLIPMLGYKLDIDSGRNLLIGLRVATQSFSVNVSPETFDAGAICLKATQPDESNPALSGSQNYATPPQPTQPVQPTQPSAPTQTV